LTDAGIYVHVPFCITRCGYCDFNAYAGLDELKPRYLRALLGEAELAAPCWDGTPFVSVFLGGGTPTTMAPADLRALLVHLRDRFALADDAEVSVEANPDTVDEASLRALRDANRSERRSSCHRTPVRTSTGSPTARRAAA
jgi:oxygen-independent coproporphyrinogen III oxidase